MSEKASGRGKKGRKNRQGKSFSESQPGTKTWPDKNEKPSIATQSTSESYSENAASSSVGEENKVTQVLTEEDFSSSASPSFSHTTNKSNSVLLNIVLEKMDIASVRNRLNIRVKCSKCQQPNSLIHDDLLEIVGKLIEVIKENDLLRNENTALQSAKQELLNQPIVLPEYPLEVQGSFPQESTEKMDWEGNAAGAPGGYSYCQDVQYSDSMMNLSRETAGDNDSCKMASQTSSFVGDDSSHPETSRAGSLNSDVGAKTGNWSDEISSNVETQDVNEWTILKGRSENRSRKSNQDGRNQKKGGQRNHSYDRDRNVDLRKRNGSCDQERERRGNANDQNERGRRMEGSRDRNMAEEERELDNYWDGNFVAHRQRENYNQGRGGEFNRDRNRPTREDVKCDVVNEVQGDLFMAPKDHSLAHCVAEDMRMGSGIATTFRSMFKHVEDLLDQRKRPGQVAVLDDNDRFIYYLVTKKVSNGKPRLSDLVSSLQEMKEHCVKNSVKNIAMPRIGCGLDRLEWREVKAALVDTFKDTEVHITVYNFQQEMAEQDPTTQRSKLRVVQNLMSLVSIESGTALVFLGTEDSAIDDNITSLDSKHNFIRDYRMTEKKVGDVIRIERRDILYGLILKKTNTDRLSYKVLNSCLTKLRNMVFKDRYDYLGIEAFLIDDDDLTMEKVISLLKNIFFSGRIEAWICWPPSLEQVFRKYDSYTNQNSNINYYRT